MLRKVKEDSRGEVQLTHVCEDSARGKARRLYSLIERRKEDCMQEVLKTITELS